VSRRDRDEPGNSATYHVEHPDPDFTRLAGELADNWRAPSKLEPATPAVACRYVDMLLYMG